MSGPFLWSTHLRGPLAFARVGFSKTVRSFGDYDQCGYRESVGPLTADSHHGSDAIPRERAGGREFKKIIRRQIPFSTLGSATTFDSEPVLSRVVLPTCPFRPELAGSLSHWARPRRNRWVGGVFHFRCRFRAFPATDRTRPDTSG